MNIILKMENIVKCYYMGNEVQCVLDNVNLKVVSADFIAILGPSGSGKTTLMNIVGCLDVPTDGNYILAGNDVEYMNETELARIRNKEIGFVFQSFQLLPRLNALENVELPLIYSSVNSTVRRKKAKEILERIGLKDKMKNYPNQLSGGQQQRVAIARAIVTEPTILLADEPTGALDQKTGSEIMKLFVELNNEGRTIIVITHDMNVAKYSKKVIEILDGKLTEKSNQYV